MAIGPEFLEEKFKNNIENMEKIIDTYLSEKAFFNNSKSLIMSVPIGMTNEIFNVLRRRYLKVGWKSVDFISDERDGDCLVFGA